MGRRIDVLRSLVRSVADGGSKRLRNMPALVQAKQLFDELKARRIRLSEEQLTNAVMHTSGIREASVQAHRERLELNLTLTDGERRVFALMVQDSRFAPRGAKEVLFALHPPEMIEDRSIRDAVGGIAAAIARGLWGPVLPLTHRDEQAFVEREGARLRADLRSVPSVRDALDGGGPGGALIDTLTIESVVVQDRQLQLTVGLPKLIPPA